MTIPGRVTTPPIVQTAPSPVALRDLADLELELRRAGQRVAALVHRRRARVRGLAAERDLVALDAERPEHDAERQIQRLEHRPLLDVQLEVARPRSRAAPRLQRAVELDAVRAQARRAAPPRPRRAAARSSSWSAIEPAAAREPNSERPKRAPSSSAQSTSRTVTAGSPSSASRRSTSTPATTFRQPSSQPPFGTESMCPPISTARSDAPAQRPPLVAGLVDLVLERQRPRACSRSQLARLLPRVRPGDALRAVLVAGQLAQLLQLGDGSRRIERHGATANPAAECGKHRRDGRRSPSTGRRAEDRGGPRSPARRARRSPGSPSSGGSGRPTAGSASAPGSRGRSPSTRPTCRTSTTCCSALTQPLQPGGPPLIHYEWHWALFTAKEALLGFALGAVDRLRARRRCSRTRGSCAAACCRTSSSRRRSRSSPSRRWSSSGSAAKGVAALDRRLRDRRLPDLLPGGDEHAARPAVARPARARADALVRGRPAAPCSGSCACPPRCRSSSRR